MLSAKVASDCECAQVLRWTNSESAKAGVTASGLRHALERPVCFCSHCLLASVRRSEGGSTGARQTVHVDFLLFAGAQLVVLALSTHHARHSRAQLVEMKSNWQLSCNIFQDKNVLDTVHKEAS